MIGARAGRLVLLGASLTATVPSLPAQVPADSTLTVRLITIGPGPLVWERFGHNALWIHDPATGTDIAYDYGHFSFETDNFILRFVEGEMFYWMGEVDANQLIRYYAGRDRQLVVQTLDLPHEARVALRDFLEWNVRPENAYYRYDYYRDNCSTRLRDALDRVLGGTLQPQVMDTVPGATLRFHTDRLLAPLLWAYAGTKAGLGRPTDRPISRWEEMFVPMKLSEYLRDVTVADGSGGSRPLVVAEDTIYHSVEFFPLAAPPRWTGWFALAGVALALVLLLLARLGAPAFGTAAFILSLLLGLGGVVLVGLWFFTAHITSAANQSVLQLSPLSLVVAALLPWGLRPRSATAGRLLVFAAGLVAAVSAAGLVLAVLRLAPQANGPIVALLLPVHVAVLAGILGLKRRRAASPAA